MAQEPSSKDLLEAVKQQESGGRRYKADGKTLLEGPMTKYGTAKGEMQVLDMTTKDPGYGVKPARDDSADERARVGRDYLNAMVKKYGDRQTALVAYNWGPGNTDKWLKKGGDFSKLPAETQNYVTKITGALGETKLARASVPATAVAAAATKPKSGLQRAVYKAAPLTHPMLSQLGPNFQAAMAVSMLADEGEKEGKSENEPSEAEKMLTEATSRPVALASADLGYQSPFPVVAPKSSAPAKQQLQSFKHGGAVHMADGGELDYFQDPMGAPSAPITADTFAKGKEFKAADALRAAKEVGRGVVRTGKAIAQGVSETPYNLLGGVADVGNMVLTPLGLGSAEPALGSAHLKRLALERGIRQAPPTDPRDLGFYTMGELGASVVNPGPIAAKVGQATEKAVATGGKAVAKEMLRGMEGQGVLAPVSPQDAIMYAVKPKGGRFVGHETSSGQFIDSVDELIQSGELMPDTRSELKIPMQSRKALNDWMQTKLARYIRSDMATENDQFVKATDQGKKLHLHENIDERLAPMDVGHTRVMEGFPRKGFAKTELGQKVEAQIDSSLFPQTVGEMERYELHPTARYLQDEAPFTRVYQPGYNLAERMQFPKMMEGMEDMLSTEKNFKAYGEFSTPIPEEYHLTPEKLQGMSPVQASEKVAMFNQWRDRERQVQAAKYLDKYGNTYKKYDNGRKWIAMDDLAEEPQQAELVQQAGCLGGWCTVDEAHAMENGSGDNRLHILFDEKAVPRVQLTVTKTTPTAYDFIEHMDYDQIANFQNKHGNLNYLPEEQIQATPEYQAWARAQDNSERITEIKGQFNARDLVKDPNSYKYLKEVQDFVKSKDWGAVTNLDGINMINLDESLPVLSRGLSPEQANQLREFMKGLNDGSLYADKNKGENILREASLRLLRPLSPPGRAMGGMVERQPSTARYI
jgi:Transglycosylase SLT domain